MRRFVYLNPYMDSNRNCGNTDVQSQVITVQDVTAPVLAGVPADVTVECDAVPAPATPTASDNCDSDVTIDFNEVRTDGSMRRYLYLNPHMDSN